MQDKGLVYKAIKFLRTQLERGLMDDVSAGAVRTVLNAADEALSLQEVLTPPAEEQNPFDYEARVTEALKSTAAWLEATYADGGAIRTLREAVALMRTELMRLRAERSDWLSAQTETVNLGALTPVPGLDYVDPLGRFNCRPAEAGWLEFAKNPKNLSVLELRVLEAHLNTAVENVTRARLAQTGGY